LNSATLEEAPQELGAWFRQRRRWFKGWYQTAITLTRTPLRLVRELGWIGTAKVAALLPSAVLAPLVWPISAALFVHELYCRGWPRPESLPELVHATLWTFVAFAGLPAVAWPVLVGMKRRGLADLWPTLPLLLPYYLLITAAAWIALYDLVRRPHHWFKTEHGLPRRAGWRARASASNGMRPNR
jgi:hypothetical protein